MTVAIPTLTAGAALTRCVEALARQTYRSFEIVVVDNGGAGAARRRLRGWDVVILENPGNAGFGAAVNQAWRTGAGPYLAVLNDDTEPCPRWLGALVEAIEQHARVGMCASRVLLAGEALVDSAGMRLCRDGSSRQRGHREPPGAWEQPDEALCPSGSAALYRRQMIDEIGGFDESFFLYCEDTDLGLRARWAGWRCVYVPDAVVEHAYSQTAGLASALKAYLVERNRLQVAIKNLPARWLWQAPAVTLARYAWHLWWLRRGRGKTSEYAAAGGSVAALGWMIVKAHAAVAWRLPRLLRQRRGRLNRISPGEFARQLAAWEISAREVASL